MNTNAMVSKIFDNIFRQLQREAEANGGNEFKKQTVPDQEAAVRDEMQKRLELLLGLRKKEE